MCLILDVKRDVLDKSFQIFKNNRRQIKICRIPCSDGCYSFYLHSWDFVSKSSIYVMLNFEITFYCHPSILYAKEPSSLKRLEASSPVRVFEIINIV